MRATHLGAHESVTVISNVVFKLSIERNRRIERFCRSLSQGLADNAVISRVNGQLWDLDRPLEQDCSLEILRFDDEDAQAVSPFERLKSTRCSRLRRGTSEIDFTRCSCVLGVLALQRSHPGGGNGELLWRLFVLRTPD